MTIVYPVVLSPINEGLLAHVPDLNIDTHGTNTAKAIEMARDAISIWCVCQEDEKKSLPAPSDMSAIERQPNDIVTLVDVDIDAYRRLIEKKAVKKTLTLPSWLNEQAEKAGLNFSQVLQKALKQELNIEQ